MSRVNPDFCVGIDVAERKRRGTSGAKALIGSGAVLAALKRCGTQKRTCGGRDPSTARHFASRSCCFAQDDSLQGATCLRLLRESINNYKPAINNNSFLC
jgi:hypothetical protein